MINKIKDLHSRCTGEFCEAVLMGGLGIIIFSCMWLSLAQLTT
jgi:hypothetical protein